MGDKKLNVLIIDDSALVRGVLKKIFDKEPDIEVMGAVVDPIYAIKKIKEKKPDVITLDLQMPRMDGLTFLKKLMRAHPLPVVVVSAKAKKSSEVTLKALELGAFDFVTKPEVGVEEGINDLASQIVHKVRSAAKANITELSKRTRKEQMGEKASKEIPETTILTSTDKIICLGASTGGTVAIRNILQPLPANLPGILVVVHMPSGFTASFAQSLDSICSMKVKEAEHRDQIVSGTCYVAPGNYHLVVKKSGSSYYIELNQDPPMRSHRPSIDKTFYSLAENVAPNSMGVVLTGMVDDGARGLKEMYDQGCHTVAQDEKTSVVFGMPKQAIKLGGVRKVLPLDKIAGSIMNYVKEN